MKNRAIYVLKAIKTGFIAFLVFLWSSYCYGQSQRPPHVFLYSTLDENFYYFSWIAGMIAFAFLFLSFIVYVYKTIKG